MIIEPNFIKSLGANAVILLKPILIQYSFDKNYKACHDFIKCIDDIYSTSDPDKKKVLKKNFDIDTVSIKDSYENSRKSLDVNFYASEVSPFSKSVNVSVWSVLGRSAGARKSDYFVGVTEITEEQKNFCRDLLSFSKRVSDDFDNHNIFSRAVGGLLYSVGDEGFWNEIFQNYQPELLNKVHIECGNKEISRNININNSICFESAAFMLGNTAALNAYKNAGNKFENVRDYIKIHDIKEEVYKSRIFYVLYEDLLNKKNDNNQEFSGLYVESVLSGSPEDVFVNLKLFMREFNPEFTSMIRNDYTQLAELSGPLSEKMAMNGNPSLPGMDNEMIEELVHYSVNRGNSHIFEILAKEAGRRGLELTVDTSGIIKNMGTNGYLPTMGLELLIQKISESSINSKEVNFDGNKNSLHFVAEKYGAYAIPVMRSLLLLGVDPHQKDTRNRIPRSYLLTEDKETWDAIVKSMKAKEIAESTMNSIFKEMKI